jgi:hyperosmotically inducible protein
MKHSIAISLLATSMILIPAVSHADGDTDRSHPMTYVKDSAITVKVKAKLADEHLNSLRHISVDTDSKGAVVLSGTARTQADVEKAISIARSTEGVMSVTSTIQVRKDD